MLHSLLHCVFQGQDHSTSAAAATSAQAPTLRADIASTPTGMATPPPKVANLQDPARTVRGSRPAGTGTGNSLLDDVDALLADAAALPLRGTHADTAASHADTMNDSVHDELGGFVLDDDGMEGQGSEGREGGGRRLSSGGRDGGGGAGGGGSSSVGGVVEEGGAIQEVAVEEVYEYQVCCWGQFNLYRTDWQGVSWELQTRQVYWGCTEMRGPEPGTWRVGTPQL